MKEKLSIKGRCLVQLFDQFSKLKEERAISNTIPPLGDAHVADRMSDLGEAAMGWMAIGTGVPTVTALGIELDRNALTSQTQGAGADDNDVIYVGDWAAGDGTGALTEAGIFNLVTLGGVMLASANFAVINKGALDTLKITWTITFGST